MTPVDGCGLEPPAPLQMASVLHMIVFALLAQREGRTKREARVHSAGDDEASGGSGGAHAAKVAQAVARSEAMGGLPSGWSVITDAATGQTAYWNQHSKQTVFTRPT